MKSFGNQRHLNTSIPTNCGSKLFFQAKQAINNPADKFEKEADAVADKVMQMETPSLQTKTGSNLFFNISPISVTPVQRKCAHCEEEEKKVQRKEINGEEKTANSNLENYVGNLNNSGQPLPNEVRNFYEPRFGYDFSNVKVHTDTVAAKSAQSINALAYTSGNNIVFNESQYSPGTDRGKRLLGHELTHVVQQNSSLVQPKLIQLERLPCTSRKVVDIFAVDMPGATGSVSADVATANAILCQCGIILNLVGGESWVTNTLDLQSPAGVLNESQAVVTDEVMAMTSHRPGGDMIHVYNAPSNTLGARGASYGYSGRHPSVNPSVSIFDNRASDSLAHEIMHVLLDDGGHHANPDNLMATGSARRVGVDELTTDQCSRIP